jgi:hypothetical protein
MRVAPRETALARPMLCCLAMRFTRTCASAAGLAALTVLFAATPRAARACIAMPQSQLLAPTDGTTDVPLDAAIWTDLDPTSVELLDPDGAPVALTPVAGAGFVAYEPDAALRPLSTYTLVAATADADRIQTFTTASANLDTGVAPLDAPSVSSATAAPSRRGIFCGGPGRTEASLEVMFAAAPGNATMWAIYLTAPGDEVDLAAPFDLTTQDFFGVVDSRLPPPGAWDLSVAAVGLNGVAGEAVEVGPIEVPFSGGCSVAAPGRSAGGAGAAAVALVLAVAGGAAARRRTRRS